MLFSRSIILLTAWAIISLPAYALLERKAEWNFPVGDGASLVVNSTDGAVNVRTVPGSREIKITVLQSVSTDDQSEADQRFSGLVLTAKETEPDRVEISAYFNPGHSWSWQVWPPVLVTYEISIPERCDLDVQAGAGGITVGVIEGRVNLTTDSGVIFAQEIKGPFTARSRSGAIALAVGKGSIDASTESGGITIGRDNGETTLASRGGFIELQRASGHVVVRGNGSDALVGFVAPIREPADIILSGGSLTLRLDNDVQGTLDLRSSFFGEINLRGALPMKINAGGIGKSRLLADINGGGPRIVAQTRGGSVLVRALAPVPVAD